MEYTVQKLGQMAGISSRTIRYYDEIGLLKPKRINSSGYRIYGEREVDQLQQILFYRKLGFSLESIMEILESPGFDDLKALKEHRERLVEKRNQIDLLINNVEKTIYSKERGVKMKDKEKFKGFKKELVNENERKYGKEAREKYGDETVDKSNQMFLNMSQEEYERFQKLTEEVQNLFEQAYKEGGPDSPIAQKACEKHKEWLLFSWPSYSKEAHRGVAQMYVDDERFAAYYEKNIKGLATFMRDAIFIYTSK